MGAEVGGGAPLGVRQLDLLLREAAGPVTGRLSGQGFFLPGFDGRWVSAEAAAVLSFLLDFGLRITSEAAVPAFFPVVSFLPI